MARNTAPFQDSDGRAKATTKAGRSEGAWLDGARSTEKKRKKERKRKRERGGEREKEETRDKLEKAKRR